MRGPKLFQIAWRNLWRNKRRTALTLLAIAFGGSLSVLVTAMEDKSFGDFIDTAARLGGGHVTLENPAYADAPTFANGLKGTDRAMAVARKDPLVAHVVQRVSGQAMISTARESLGVMFIAYDPATESPKTFSIFDGKVTGRWLKPGDTQATVLGSRLAHNLDVGLGDKVVYTLTDAHGQIVTALARVAGIVHTGTPSLDAGLALLPLGAAQTLLGYGPDEATLVAVFLRDARQAPVVAGRLGRALGPSVASLTWDEVRPELRAMIAMKVGGARFMEVLVMLLVAAGIFNTLFVSVTERMREFGILLAIGYQPFQVFRMVVWESLWLGLTGLVVGTALTAWPYWHLHTVGVDMSKAMGGASTEVGGVGFNPILHFAIYPEHLALILVAVIGATLLAGLYPAWRAGRVDPVDVIKLV